MSRIIISFGFLLILPFLAASPASAQAAGAARCVSMQNDYERLVCYDALYSHLRNQLRPNAPARGVDGYNLPNSDRNAVNTAPDTAPAPMSTYGQKEKKSFFGLSLPWGGKKEKGKDTLRSGVARIRTGDSGYIITLENGMVWRQINDRKKLNFEGGDMALVFPGAVGSFFLKLEGKKGRIRVKRAN